MPLLLTVDARFVAEQCHRAHNLCTICYGILHFLRGLYGNIHKRTIQYTSNITFTMSVFSLLLTPRNLYHLTDNTHNFKTLCT